MTTPTISFPCPDGYPPDIEEETLPHAALLQELGSSEAQLAPTLRAVYDGGEADSFFDALEKYIARADAEIEKLCNNHYKVCNQYLWRFRSFRGVNPLRCGVYYLLAILVKYSNGA